MVLNDSQRLVYTLFSLKSAKWGQTITIFSFRQIRFVFLITLFRLPLMFEFASSPNVQLNNGILIVKEERK